MDTGAIVTIVTAVITAVAGIAVGKRQGIAKARKVEAEADSIVVNSADKAVKMWEELNEQLRQDLETTRLRMAEIHKEYERVHSENVELIARMAEMEKENTRLNTKMAEMEKVIEQLKAKLKQ